jgi:hypothetical protein
MQASVRIAALNLTKSFTWPFVLICSRKAFSLGRVSCVVPCDGDKGLEAATVAGGPGCGCCRCSRELVIMAAGCTKAASNDLFFAGMGRGILTVAHRTFDGCVC